ncbi:MAG: tetratricopeptide repeat protein, partial [Deltaproteobacteria bacterium]|nr:tetratricopeptide repeat protein [Deltaproteobacteria bacterium]
FVTALIVGPQKSLAQANDSREIFGKAYQLYSSGKPAQAKELFQQSIDTTHPLADYSLYYLARIAVDEADRDPARKYVEQLRQRYRQSVWYHAATLLRAKLDIAEKKFAAAGESLRQLRADKSVPRELANEAHYLQAQLHEAQGTPAETGRAFALYRELRNAAPDSRWAAAARKDQARLRGKFPDQFGLNTTASQADEADRLARERQVNDAEDLYKKILRNVSEPAERLRYLVKLASLYLSAGSRNDALPVLEEIARDHAENGEAPKALYQIGQIYWNRHDNGRAFEYFKILLEKYPTSAFADRAQYASADIHEYFGRKEEAIQHYAAVQKQFPRSPVRDDAAWRLAWLHYRGGDYALAQGAFRTLAGRGKNGPFANAAIYWQGRCAEKLGDSETAKQVYRQLVNGGEESYYQALARGRLEQLGAPLEISQRNTPAAANSEPEPPLRAELSFHLSRARDLAALSLHQLAVAEIDEVNRRAKASDHLRALVMREYFNNQAYGRSLALAQQLPYSQSDRDLYRYPLAYWDAIRQKTVERGVDPYLVLALIRQESLFNT